MGYDRYDTRQGPRDERSRWRDDQYGDRREGRERDHGRDEDRGFFERAGEEIASWFGGSDDDERDQQRRREGPGRDQDYARQQGRGGQRADEREWMGGRSGGQRDEQRERGWMGGRSGGQRDDQRERGWFGGSHERDDQRERGQQRFSHDRGDDDRASRSSWSSSGRDHNPSSRRELWGGGDREQERGRERYGDRDREREGGYRPMTGDYSRSEGLFAASGYGRGDPRERGSQRDQQGRGEQYGRSQSNFDRDEYRRTSFAGSSERSNHDDPHYQEWRRRQMEDLDRDYDEYRRENRSRFESDFGDWRNRRQSKRQMLGQIREHMEVVGRDEKHVGTVDRVAGDRIILTKSDPEAGGVHHSLSCTDIDRVEGGRVILDYSADQARERWRDDDRSRALFERDDQGEAGAHMLDRSFSGTYR
jgi:hypothetical protein